MAGEIPPLLLDLAVVLAVAAVATIIFNRLRQPVVLGYLLAGLIVGPHTPPFAFVSDIGTINTLGDLGVIFLLFALGLEFNFRKLRKVGLIALVSGTLQVAFMLGLGYVVGLAFGLDPLSAIFLGAIVSISSTVIIVKAVSELGQQDEEWAHVVFGILLVEDVLAVLMLTALSAVGGAESLSFVAVASVLGTFTLFIITVLVVGLLIVPRLVTWVGRLGVDEVLVITAIALGFGLAILGGLLGFSPVLGAFIMGALIAESPAHAAVEERILPIRDLFTAIFFVTVGMLVSPAAVLAHWPLIAAVTAAVIVGKIFAGSFATFLTGRNVPTSLRVGFGLAQVGEFSFIIAALALALGVTDAPLFTVAVSAAGITAFTTPYLIRHSGSVTRRLERLAPRPLRTYGSLYGSWIRHLSRVSDTNPNRKRATRAFMQALVFGVVAITIVAMGGNSVSLVGEAVARQTGTPQIAQFVGWLVLGVVALPFVVLYVQAQRTFADALATAALPRSVRESENGATILRILRGTFHLAGLIVATSFLAFAVSPFLPAVPVLLVALVAVGVAAFPFYRSLTRFQGYVDGALSGVLGDDLGKSEAREERRELLEIIRDQYPWAVSVREVRLPSDRVTTPQSLRQLHVRGRTGATVVALHRAGRNILNPPPDTTLLPGDHVILLGEDDQLDAAQALLLSEAVATKAHDVAEPRELTVQDGSAIAGQTLKSLRLPDVTGVTVVAVRRGRQHIPNPPPDLGLEPGDVLVVLGTEEQYDRARRLGRPSGEG